MIDYSYLSPPSKVHRIKVPNGYAYEQINGKRVRYLFCRSHYESFQLQAIQKLKDYLKRKAPNVDYSNQLLLRFNYLGNFMISDVTEKVKLYDQWHQNDVIRTLQKPGRQILQNGHIYTYGRDYQYCPVIIIRPQQIDLRNYQPDHYLNAVCNLLDPLQRFMLVGGVIQKWNVLVDLEGKKVNINVELLIRCLTRIAYAYPFRLKRLMFLNIHSQTQSFIKHIQSFLKSIDSQAQIQILRNIEDIDRYIGNDEREKKYGGALSNLCEYWPIHTTNKYEQSESQPDSDSEYKSVVNDAIYFQESKTPLCDFSNNCQIY